jgi:molybdopterin converting factor small subunit
MFNFKEYLKKQTDFSHLIDVSDVSIGFLEYVKKLEEVARSFFTILSETIGTPEEEIVKAAKERQRIVDATNALLARFDELTDLRIKELREIRAIQSGSGICISAVANDNVEKLNNAIGALQITINDIGMAANRIVVDMNELIDLVNDVHKNAKKNPIGSRVAMINKLKSGFKKP